MKKRKEDKPVVLEPLYDASQVAPAPLAAAPVIEAAQELDYVETVAHDIPVQPPAPGPSAGAGMTVRETQSAPRPTELQQSKPQVLNPAAQLVPKP